MTLISKIKTEELLRIAEQGARLAGDHLRKNFASGSKVNQELDHDIKLQADLDSEKILIDHFQQATDYSILSEERGRVAGAEEELTWIIDPVDGTYNYLRQIPICCVSIGLWRKDEPLLGVIYDFNRNEMFSGIMNQQSWLNGQPIKVTSIKEKNKGVVLSGLPSRTDFSTESLGGLIKSMQTYKKVRFLGSAALMMAYVACGRSDIYVEQDIMLWDVAGGIPIVTGAGGIYKMESARREHCYNVWVSNGQITP